MIKFHDYLNVLWVAIIWGSLMVLTERIKIRSEISYKLGKHSRKKWKKICAGQSFREWYFFERFKEGVAPLGRILYQFILTIVTVALSASAIILHYADTELTYLRIISIITDVFFLLTGLVNGYDWYRYRYKSRLY